MIIEAVRLVVTLALTAAGFLLGRASPALFGGSDTAPDTAVVIGAVIGAGVGYVAGGLFGRLVRRGLDRAPEMAARATGPELFAGAFGLIAGLLVGVAAAVPSVMLLPQLVGWPVGALLVIVAASYGSRVFAARSEDLLAAAGLGVRRRPAGADGSQTFVVDSSAAIDGRVLDLAQAGLVRGEVVVPVFVLDELQGIADSGDLNRRRRGRRGLDVLDAIGGIPGVILVAEERSYPEFPEVDAKLMGLAADLEAVLVTTDHNLSRAAGLRGISVLDLQALGDSLRSGPVTGDRLEVVIEKEGTEPGQGVAYLDDGTLVVIEGAASDVGATREVEIAGALRTSVGKMLFARLIT
ncbi:MAG: TRAM domain-containing protein [Actinomycetota bacterium]|jgi:uncharacterized protein YacL|nr:TRAM domain-containing protein [Actinomycetota bacterium]